MKKKQKKKKNHMEINLLKKYIWALIHGKIRLKTQIITPYMQYQRNFQKIGGNIIDHLKM